MRIVGGVAAIVMLVAWGNESRADSSTDTADHKREATVEPEFRSKKDRMLDDKVASEAKETVESRTDWDKHLDKRIGKDPVKVINIFNTWTHEFVVVDYTGKATGKTKLQTTEEAVNRFLRCHFTDEPTEMDKRLFKVLVDAANHFGSQRVDIISGFRAPKYNLMLRKKGHGVARRSQHKLGNAVDFRVRGVATSKLRSWARNLRLGGVGYYPSSGFVHVDVGPVRTWTGK